MIKVVWYCTIVSVLSYDVARTVILYVVSARRSFIDDTIPRPEMKEWSSKFTYLHLAVNIYQLNTIFYEYLSHRWGPHLKNKLSVDCNKTNNLKRLYTGREEYVILYIIAFIIIHPCYWYWLRGQLLFTTAPETHI